ncbi:MAG: 16S rRNA (guanine527-N7)-methyltransferase [Paracoccaceae bacterium]|jgi:16S rRNA (guanine527-N7)-methyltransferase
MTEDEAKAAIEKIVSRETLELLNEYAAFLTKWQGAINLVSQSSLSEMWSRHFLDSAQIFQYRPDDATSWLDIGSGAGFPGMVCALMAKDAAPNLKFSFVESDIRKCVFLRAVAHELEIEADVISDRIEIAIPQGADVLTARALAPLVRLCEFATRHMKPDGTAFFLKGERFEAEVAAAQDKWMMDLTTLPSETSLVGKILKVRNIQRV